MSIHTVEQLTFDFFDDKAIVIEHSELPLTSDAGLLPLRQFDAKIGLSAQLAQALYDPRDPQRIEHTVAEMLRSRLFAILADYHDQNDHDTLRSDPVFKLIAGRAPQDNDLASQPTLSRFENSIDIASLKRLRDVLIDQFIASFAAIRRIHGSNGAPGRNRGSAWYAFTNASWVASSASPRSRVTNHATRYARTRYRATSSS